MAQLVEYFIVDPEDLRSVRCLSQDLICAGAIRMLGARVCARRAGLPGPGCVRVARLLIRAVVSSAAACYRELRQPFFAPAKGWRDHVRQSVELYAVRDRRWTPQRNRSRLACVCGCNCGPIAL